MTDKQNKPTFEIAGTWGDQWRGHGTCRRQDQKNSSDWASDGLHAVLEGLDSLLLRESG